jgi:hypothetical protein
MMGHGKLERVVIPELERFHSASYLLAAWSRVLQEKLIVAELVRKFPAFKLRLSMYSCI